MRPILVLSPFLPSRPKPCPCCTSVAEKARHLRSPSPTFSSTGSVFLSDGEGLAGEHGLEHLERGEGPCTRQDRPRFANARHTWSSVHDRMRMSAGMRSPDCTKTDVADHELASIDGSAKTRRAPQRSAARAYY